MARGIGFLVHAAGLDIGNLPEVAAGLIAHARLDECRRSRSSTARAQRALEAWLAVSIGGARAVV